MAVLATKLSRAAVYPDQARLIRSGSLALDVGIHTLEITDLPVELYPDSLRAAARGSARARLLGVQSQSVYYSETPVEDVRKLEIELESAQDRLRALEAQAETAKQSRAALTALLGQTDTYALGLAGGELSLDAQASLFEHVRKQIAAVDDEAQSLAVQRREVERQIERLKNQLNELRGAQRRQRVTAFVDLEILQAGELTVELTYMVNSASWKPLYDVRLQEQEGNAALELTCLAEINQKTGEPWQAVSLSLSTARPVLAGVLPELDPWYIQPFIPPTPRVYASRAAGATPFPPAALSFASADMAAPKAAEEFYEAEAATASVESSGAAVTYHVPGTINIPNDGQPHKVTVMSLALPPRLDYVTAPRLVEAVYRRVKTTNDSPYLLLAGPVNLFAGDEFIGATEIELTAPQAEIELFLGVDDRIKVVRELKRREIDKTLIGGKRRLRVGYEIKLENLLPRQVQVTLHDQIPVPRHEDIKVRLETIDPRPTKQTELNLLEWEFNLAEKEKRLVRFDFLVEYPQEMLVTGLP